MNSCYEKVIVAMVVLSSLVLSSGCSTAPSVKQGPAPSGIETKAESVAMDTEGWWHLRFKIYWSGADKSDETETEDETQDEVPAWNIGPLIADRIIAPVIKEQGKDIFLWRFHRRAADDETGHQFSFIFYSKPEVADKVVEAVKANLLVEDLIESGHLVAVKYPDTSTIDKPFIADTADQRWPDEIKKTWPIFIMGASEMWLMMVESLAEANPGNKQEMDVEALVQLYLEVEQELDALWREESRHAYFHHLNALFGYEYLLVRF